MARGRFTIIRSHAPGVLPVLAESAQAFARHTHEQFGIGVIDRGAQTSRSGRGQVEAARGDVITVNPGEVHDGTPIEQAGRSWRMLYLDVACVAEAARTLGAAGTYEFERPVVGDVRMAAAFGRLFAAMTSDDPVAPLASEGRLLELLAALRDGGRRTRTPGVPHALARAKALIDDDPASPVTLAALSQASGLDRFRLLRAFAQATGLTPHAYLVQRRIDLARRLIAGGQPLSEVALASGFADQSHMTRVFVRKYGISPGAYATATA
ncbi:AraC family transcriptional regulator [Luteimonas sp. M1R5S18]|uniref:AraC family transcriptional regulator n=1 Tax=Luteimonas rhizosphaericola TaxID=3042024 RepID=A0ABT6JNI4_9GAMM|nr:AraC family transcriptional regulator [Luteimonas rhizosphaericola]MDH5831531.1 AraC family transcriptional regulator [Luteimonas rhizosphaericola]